MKITENTEIKKVDLQGIWETKRDTVQETYESVINTLWIEDRLETQEFDEMMKEKDINKKLAEILIFGDIYEFEFLAILDNKDFTFKSDGTILEQK